MSGIVTSTSTDGTGCCTGWYPSLGFSGCGGLYGVSPTIFVSYSSDVPSETLSLTSTSSFSSL